MPLLFSISPVGLLPKYPVFIIRPSESIDIGTADAALG
jgi:hypothetical protein